MLENIFNGLLEEKRTDCGDVCEKEDGLGKYLIIIMVIFVLLGGLKLFFKSKEEKR